MTEPASSRPDEVTKPSGPQKTAAIELGRRVNRIRFHLDQYALIDDAVVEDAPAAVLSSRPYADDHYCAALELISRISNDLPSGLISPQTRRFLDLVSKVYALVERNRRGEFFYESTLPELRDQRAELNIMEDQGASNECVREAEIGVF
ncbi:hypothetical protein Pla175_12820 [Pirellulimonas nuda]|uniref:Uncharacterized protein n=1 Tax=Pirellulimonas nuda TaxID=2528009 RepID=A0A518D8W8_9BACT|nr:hypothetical protein [Pirellulimonas nuda]QDU87915.1 hypothetical protein Pla175_12820 [Pirellulimonas nuda]